MNVRGLPGVLRISSPRPKSSLSPLKPIDSKHRLKSLKPPPLPPLSIESEDAREAASSTPDSTSQVFDLQTSTKHVQERKKGKTSLGIQSDIDSEGENKPRLGHRKKLVSFDGASGQEHPLRRQHSLFQFSLSRELLNIHLTSHSFPGRETQK
jgi:hypothetical protein